MTEVTVHRCPPIGESRTPCCNRTVFELPTTDQLALSDDAVTCHPEPEPDTPDDEILAMLSDGFTRTARTTQAWGIRCHRDGRTYGIKVMDITNLDPDPWADQVTHP
jgi:hypothetical protein